MHIAKKLSQLLTATVTGVAMLAMMAVAIPASAADPASPVGCNADNSVVNIARSTASAEVGETITFSVEAGNPASATGCDITGRTMTLTLPDGTFTAFGPINYPNPTALTFVGSLNYVADSSDLIGNTWTATVTWTGTLKDGFDNPSNGSKQISVNNVPVSLVVTKTADEAFNRTHRWTIDKSVDVAVHNLLTGENGTSSYDVLVTKTTVDSNYAVSGTITIHNPAQFASANVTSVTDSITGVGAVAVTCPGDPGPYVIAPGADLVCTYSSSLTDGSTRTNTATAVTSGDVGGDSGDASVDFTGVVPTIVGFDTINVNDSVEGALGSTTVTHTFEYDRVFTCDADEGDHPNIATIVETQDNDNASVTVNCLTPSTDVSASVDVDVILDGDSVVLTITETNDGGTDLLNAFVDLQPLGLTLDEVHAGFSSNGNGDSTLAAGETWTWTVNDTPTGDITYVATGHGTDSLGNDVTWCADTQNPPANTVCDQDERAEVSVDMINPTTITTITSSADQVIAGGTVTLTVTEQNDGDVDLTGAHVDVDNGIGTLSAPPTAGDDGDGILEPGETWSWTVSNVVINADTTFTATGHGTDPLGNDVTYPADPEEQDSVTVTTFVPQWCSPGYWRNHLDEAGIAADLLDPSGLDSLYSDHFGSAPTLSKKAQKDGADSTPSLLQVLQSPQWYGGAAFNMVGDLLSEAHPDVDFTEGGERVEDSCPLN